MKTEINRIFKQFNQLEPPENLRIAILQNIKKRQLKVLKIRLFFSCLGLFFSGVGILYVFLNFGKLFWQSEFWTIFSLLFSDILLLAKNWGSFTYSLLETFPVINFILLLTPVFTFFLFFYFFLSLRNQYPKRQLKFAN